MPPSLHRSTLGELWELGGGVREEDVFKAGDIKSFDGSIHTREATHRKMGNGPEQALWADGEETRFRSENHWQRVN